MPRSKVGKSLTRARNRSHGNFADGAAVTQGIMRILQGTTRWVGLSDVKKEALHMIVHKVHRITTGDSEHVDHWDDIGGYAQLGANDCSPPVKKKKRKVQVKKQKPAVKKAKVQRARPAPEPVRLEVKKKKRIRAPLPATLNAEG